MTIRRERLAGVVTWTGARQSDERGGFARLFCERELQPVLAGRRIVQANLSTNRHAGTVRGMHFQHPPHAETKLVRCLRGRVWDVVVDLRAGSPTFLQWHGQELSGDNGELLVVPEGFAHGFQALEDGSELLYLHTAFHAPEAEGALHCEDPRLAIRWPLPVAHLSARDQAHPFLTAGFAGLAP